MYYIFSTLSILIVLYTIFFIGYRIFYKSGYKIKKIKLSSKKDSYIPDKKECTKVFGISLFIRVFIILFSIAIFLLFINQNGTVSQALNNWTKWDSWHYIRISHGYDFYIENGNFVTLVFFPAYPLFIKAFSFIFSDTVSSLLVSNLAFSIASVYIYKLVSLDFGKRTAILTLVFFNVFPLTFFFSGIMSESVFLMFSAITLYYARKHKWLLSGIFGLFCALSRSLGVFIIFPVVVELFEEYKVIKNIKNYKYLIKKVLVKMIPLLLIPLGFGIYLYINYHVTGEWFYFLKMQSTIWFQHYEHFFLFFKTVFDMFSGYETKFVCFVTIPNLVIITLSYIVLFLNARNKVTMYTAWLLVNIIVNTSMSWPLSVFRYMSCAIPLYVFIADYLKKHRILYISYLVISIILFITFFVAFFIYSCVF